MKPKLKNILALSWPFLALAFFLVWGWIYIKPMLPDDFITFDKIKNIFTKEEPWVHPDAKYNFHYIQDNLKPKTLEELEGVSNPASVETPNLGVSTTVVASTKDLQTAIKTAQPGAIIKLASGIYKTKLFIDKDLTIIGQGTSTILIGGNDGTALYVENSKFYLSQLTIKDSYSAIKLNNSKGEITKSIIKDNQKSGIELRNSEFVISENIITQNQSYGIFADANSNVQIEGNFIDDNKGFEARIESSLEIYK